MQIPDAATALEQSTRPRRTRSQPEVHKRAMTTVLTSISRAVAAGLTSTVVDVPTFVFGEPRFCIDDLTAYVRDNLEHRGYHVDTFDGVPSVAINWGTQCAAQRQVRSKPDQASADPYDIGL